MRGGLPSHPSLEPCSESSWSQPTGLNCPAEKSLKLGASHNSHHGKTPMPGDPPPFQNGAIRDRMSNLSDHLILALTSDARDIDSGL